ncbi:MAG: F0F1 ATP synthase subunit delta [Pseudomonadota bacterium]
MAEISTLARPYAKAVFELAQASQGFASWSKQLAAIAEAAAVPAVAQAIRAPGVGKSQLAAVLIEALKSVLDAQGQSLVKLLAQNHRLQAAASLAEQYEVLRAEAETRVAVEITTAAPVADAQKNALSAAVTKKLNRAVDIVWSTDESLITGARIKAGDLVIDGSASGELERLKAALLR